jgi:hypothetical protein
LYRDILHIISDIKLKVNDDTDEMDLHSRTVEIYKQRVESGFFNLKSLLKFPNVTEILPDYEPTLMNLNCEFETIVAKHVQLYKEAGQGQLQEEISSLSAKVEYIDLLQVDVTTMFSDMTSKMQKPPFREGMWFICATPINLSQMAK